MPITTTLRKAVSDATPVYAAVGATELALERVREAREQAIKTREQFVKQATQAREDYAFDTLSTKAQARVNALVDEVVEEVHAYPSVARERGRSVAARAQKSYEDLATRGADLVKRIREQQSTQDFLSQAESTIALGKGAVTSVRHAAADIERSAKATLTVGRREAASTTEAVLDTVAEGVESTSEEVAAEVTESAKRTSTAAKRTTTTARKRTSAAKSSAKAARTSASKTASKAATAAKDAAKAADDAAE